MARCILGIDAAWTERGASGVALLRDDGRSWSVVAAAPSYEAFLAIARGEPVDWSARPRGSAPDPGALVTAAEAIAGCGVRLVALDIPIAKTPFSGRRAADNAISGRYGGRGCSAHSPTSRRPGPLGARLTADLATLALPLATSLGESASGPCSVEVYPHPALLSLLDASYRVPYKVARSTRYWAGSSPQARVGLLLAEFERIHQALSERLGPIPFALPAVGEVSTLSELKCCEDALDALICAWVGVLVLSGKAEPLGDQSAAVWVPAESCS